jgi:hypothetical protein
MTSHVGWVKGDRPDQSRYTGPEGWGLGHEAEYLLPVKIYTIRKPLMKASESDIQLGTIKGTMNWDVECVDSV